MKTILVLFVALATAVAIPAMAQQTIGVRNGHAVPAYVTKSYGGYHGHHGGHDDAYIEKCGLNGCIWGSANEVFEYEAKNVGLQLGTAIIGGVIIAGINAVLGGAPAPQAYKTPPQNYHCRVIDGQQFCPR